MATLRHLVPFLLLAFARLTWAQDDTATQETTTHINPHLPVTPASDEAEDHAIGHSHLYKGRPLITIQFGSNSSNVTPLVSATQPSTIPTSTAQHFTIPTSTAQPFTIPISTTRPFTIPTSTAQPTTGSRWVYNGGRWHKIHSDTDSTSHTNGSGEVFHGNGNESGHDQHHGTHVHVDANGSGHDRHHGTHVHVDSSETNSWKHAIHHDLKSGQMHKHYSKTTDKSGHSSPEDSSSSSGSHSESGQIHGSSGSGESGSTGSGEHSADGSGSE